MTFQDLRLIAPILSALGDLGYKKPSPIQEKAIPPALAGRDVLGCAQTGTGKTCAFATPILQQLYQRDGSKPVKGPRSIRALILTPTRELALQIQESFELYGKNLPLRSAVIFGGVGQQPQVDKLRAGVDILVATPGRLQDLYDQGYIHVEDLEIFVLDEADRMLDMGFIHDVRKILKWLPQKKQTLFFSATMPPEVQGLVDSLLHDPVKVAVDPVSSPVEIIDQKLYYVDRGNKSKLLAQLIGEGGVKNALVFTRTKHGANKVAGDLAKAGIPAAAIHGNKSQTARQQALSDFKAGKIKALVATDIAARGLDIEELSHVFNYNLPDVPETYVHRIGRTGRAGRGGTAVSFCEFGEKELLLPIEKLLKKPIPVVEGHPYPMQNFEAPKRDKHGKIVNADDQEARQAARERKQQRDAAKGQGSEGRSSAGTKAEAGKGAPAKAGQGPVRLESGPRREAKKQQLKQEKTARKEPVTPVIPTSRQERPAQTAAAGKRQSAGYKPSKTLDEALTAMAPKGGSRREERRKERAPEPAVTTSLFGGDAAKQAAFEKWMAEERAIQAKQQKKFGSSALDGEVIMDATARLLAPKGSLPASQPKREERQSEQPRQSEQRREKDRGQKQAAQQPTRQEQPRKGLFAKKEKPKAQQPGPGKKPEPKREAPKKAEPVKKAEPAKKAEPGKKEAPAPQRDKARRSRRSRPMEVTLNLGSQKDSTEQQGSLMKPYYFNPDED